MQHPLSELETILEYNFKDKKLLEQALTHRSANPKQVQYDYERLEFLGDRVLGLVIAHMLFDAFPEDTEGNMAKRLAVLVSRETCTHVAQNIHLFDFIILAKGERDIGTHGNPSILANACESIIAALYLDGGFAVARAFVEQHWFTMLEACDAPPQNPKATVQEWAQMRHLPLPVYKIVKQTGSDHKPIFSIELSVADCPKIIATGLSKRVAEQEAAKAFIQWLRENNKL